MLFINLLYQRKLSELDVLLVIFEKWEKYV